MSAAATTTTTTTPSTSNGSKPPPPASTVSEHPNGTAFKCNENQLSIITYNCLAQAYVDERYHFVKPQSILEWKNRLPAILEIEIKTFDSDIANPLNPINAPEIGYAYAIQNDKNRGKEHPTANAILYRAKKFSAVWVDSRSRAVLVALEWARPAATATATATATAVSTAAGSADSKDTKSNAAAAATATATATTAATATDSDSKSTTAAATVETPPTYIYIANVHLEGLPNKVDIRIQQVSSALKSIQKKQTDLCHTASVSGSSASTITHAARPSRVSAENSGTIVIGDYNENATRGCVSEFLLCGALEANQKDADYGVVATKTRLTHPYSFTHAYYGATPPVTFCGPGMGGVIFPDVLDFVYYTAPALRLVSRYQVIASETELKNIKRTCLPNASHPSDHLPIGAVFERVDVPILPAPTPAVKAAAPMPNAAALAAAEKRAAKEKAKAEKKQMHDKPPAAKGAKSAKTNGAATATATAPTTAPAASAAAAITPSAAASNG